jgi:hypothetical protein
MFEAALSPGKLAWLLLVYFFTSEFHFMLEMDPNPVPLRHEVAVPVPHHSLGPDSSLSINRSKSLYLVVAKYILLLLLCVAG